MSMRLFTYGNAVRVELGHNAISPVNGINLLGHECLTVRAGHDSSNCSNTIRLKILRIAAALRLAHMTPNL